MNHPKRLCAALVALTLLLATVACPATAATKEDTNMFKNGDFTQGLRGWEHWTQDESKGTFRVVKGGGPDGSDCVQISNSEPIATSLFQFVPCKQGGRYLMTCDIKYENVTGGTGACLGISTYDSANNNIGEWTNAPFFGDSGWRTVTFIFEITNNATRVNGGPRLWFSTGDLYVDNVSLVEITDTPATSGTYALTLSETPNRHKVDALGCEWDPKLLLEVNRKHGVTEADLDTIKASMKTLGLQAVRMMIDPQWFEPTNDNSDPQIADAAGFAFDNDEMRSVFAYLKICEELGVRVTLTWWGAPDGHWLACKDIGDWIGAPNDLDEMAENIAYLLGYIRKELGYTCVKELILQNEPSYSFKVDGGAVDFDHYVRYYKTVHERLKADGMADIVLVGADDSQHFGWYYQSVGALKDICGKFDSHNYAWSYDLPYLDMLAQEFVSARTAISDDVPFYLGEFGDGSTVGAYVATSTDTYGRGLYVASVVINAFKAGAAGASYWPLHDVYYYENTAGGDNGGLMSQGLISFKKDGAWGYRPTYYAYGLLCNTIPFGSEIYDIAGDTDHYVDTVAAKTPDGRWSILAVNRSDAAQTITVSADAIGTNLQKYAFVDGTLPTDGRMIPASEKVAPVNGAYTLTLPAESLIVLSSIGMSEEDMAVEGPPPAETTDDTASEPLDTTTGENADTTSTDTEHTSNTSTTGTAAVGGAEEPSDKGCASALLPLALPAALATALVLRKRRKA